MARFSDVAGTVRRRSAVYICAAAAALLVVQLIRYGIFVSRALNYQFSIDFGEGIVWQQLALLFGPRMYGDINKYPYIVFHYTPLYHFVVRLLEAFNANVLYAGRAVSAISTLAICLAIYFGARRMVADQGLHGFSAVLVCAICAAFPLSFPPFWFWSVLLRADFLALALTAVGFSVALQADRSGYRPYLAMLLFVLAVYTKQTTISAPISMLAIWALRDLRFAVRLGFAGLVLGLVPLAVMSYATEGGFLRHIFFYNINPFDLRYLYWAVRSLRGELFGALVIVAAALWLVQLLRIRVGTSGLLRTLRRDPAAFRLAMLGAYITGTSLMLVSLGKEGATVNYFNEWFVAGSIAMGLLLAEFASAANRPQGTGWPPRTIAFVIAIPCLLFVHLARMPSPALPRDMVDPAVTQGLTALLPRVRGSELPVLSDEMVLLMRAGKEVPLESAIFGALARKGVWDERPFLDMIEKGKFAFVLTEGDAARGPYAGRFTTAMRNAIAQAYPKQTPIGPYTLHERP